MCPLYEYECHNGHVTERLRQYPQRDDPATCKQCKEPAKRLPPMPHAMPDGMYSYAPNIGSEAAFARRLDGMREGQKVFKKEAPTQE